MSNAAMPDPWLGLLRERPIIAVVREADPNLAFRLGSLSIEAGIVCVEIASTTPNYPDVIAQLLEQHPGSSVGAGTVTSTEIAYAALSAGAQFLMAPVLTPAVLTLGRDQGVPMIPGALTPQEIWQAFQVGATAVKVFPIESAGGIRYLQHLTKPLGSLPLIPTGGVSIADSRAYLRAGAWAVGLGSELFPDELVRGGDWPRLRQRIAAFLDSLSDA